MLSFINIWNPYRFCKDLIDIRQLHFRKISPRILLHTNNVHCNRLQCTCRHSHMSGLYRSVSCVDNAAHKTHLDKHTLRCFLTFPETEALFKLNIITYCFQISNLKSPSSSLTDNLQKCMENKLNAFFYKKTRILDICRHFDRCCCSRSHSHIFDQCIQSSTHR